MRVGSRIASSGLWAPGCRPHPPQLRLTHSTAVAGLFRRPRGVLLPPPRLARDGFPRADPERSDSHRSRRPRSHEMLASRVQRPSRVFRPSAKRSLCSVSFPFFALFHDCAVFAKKKKRKGKLETLHGYSWRKRTWLRQKKRARQEHRRSIPEVL